MYTFDELKTKAIKMLAYLKTKSGAEPNDLIDRAETLLILIAESSECLADAKYMQDSAIGSAIQKAINESYDKRLSPSTINKFVSAEAKEFNYLVNVFDRINAAATHGLDGIRTIISYRKSEMSL